MGERTTKEQEFIKCVKEGNVKLLIEIKWNRLYKPVNCTFLVELLT